MKNNLKSDLSEDVRQFIYNNVDSIELLEVLFYLRNRGQFLSSTDMISKELRSSVNSVAKRIESLILIGLIEQDATTENSFKYNRKNVKLDKTIEELYNEYRIRPHKIFEAIFNSSRQAKYFADAFLFTTPEKKKGD